MRDHLGPPFETGIESQIQAETEEADEATQASSSQAGPSKLVQDEVVVVRAALAEEVLVAEAEALVEEAQVKEALSEEALVENALTRAARAVETQAGVALVTAPPLGGVLVTIASVELARRDANWPKGNWSTWLAQGLREIRLGFFSWDAYVARTETRKEEKFTWSRN